MALRTNRTTFLFVAAGLSLGAMSAEAAPRQDFRPREVVRHSLFGTQAFIGGEFRASAPASDPVAVAREFLSANRSLIGFKNPDTELKVISVIPRDELGMGHVKLAHLAGGLPVFGSEVVVHMQGNLVTSFNGTYLPSLSMDLTHRVSAADAAGLAIDHLRDLINTGDADLVAGRDEALRLDARPELGVYSILIGQERGTPTELAWRMAVNGFHYFISAKTGRVLDAFDGIHTAMNREVYTAKNTSNLPGTLVCSESKGCTTNDADLSGIWDQFGQTYNYFKSTHSRDSYDNRGAKLIGTGHYSQNFVNAYWDGKQMVFGDDMVANDVTAHELGHAVCQLTANLTYKKQSGALNESYSDVWGAMVDRNDWLIGEDLSIGAIRDMQDPNAYNQPKDMDEYKNYRFYDNGGVHINSGIPNFAAYLLSDGGVNKGVTVKRQGSEKTEKIWYRTETTKLTSSSQFTDFAKLAVQACNELYGAGSATCTETNNAFKAVKIVK